MKRLLVALLLLALLIHPVSPAEAQQTHKDLQTVFPVQPHINVTRLIDLSYGYLANVTDKISINSTEPFNAFSFALPSIAFDISVKAENASASLIPGKTYEINGTSIKRFTVVLDRNVTNTTITLTYYFFNAFINETRKGHEPSEKDVFAIVKFTTVPISKYTYDYVRLNVTFPPRSKPLPDLSIPNNGSLSVTTLYREFENYTALLPGYDLVAVAETEYLPFVIPHAKVTIQFTTGSEVYVKREMHFHVLGSYNYSGPFTTDEPKSAIRMIYILLPKSIDEVKFYDDLGVLVNVTKYPWGDYRRREIKTRTPLVGNISDYRLTFYYKINVSMGFKEFVNVTVPYAYTYIQRLDIRIVSPPFGALSKVYRPYNVSTEISTGSRHLPVYVAETHGYNITQHYYIAIEAYRSLMTYVGMPIIGAVGLIVIVAITLYLISLVPPPERVEVELPDEVKRAIEVLEELASVGELVVRILEKPMKMEERIRLLESIRAGAEAKLQEAIGAINKVGEKEYRDILLAAAGIGAAIIAGIRRIEDIEKLRPKMTRAVYTAALAEAAAFVDSSYRRMMAMLVNLKL